MRRFLYMLCVLPFWFLAGSCSNTSEKKPSEQSQAFNVERDNFFNDLKHQTEISTLVPGLPAFDPTIVHDAAVYPKYAGNGVKAAVNLGIYIADLNYSVAFRQRDQVKMFFTAAYELSKTIQVEQKTLGFLRTRYESNLENNDSLRTVVNQLFSASTIQLQGGEHERMAGLAMAGYQLENLHLALNTLAKMSGQLSPEQESAKASLVNYINSQRDRWEIIYNFIKVHTDPLDPDRNPDYPFFDNALRELLTTYRNIRSDTTELTPLREKVESIRQRVIR
jgi:hypothetical protein